jgi:hypothetical protein
MPRVPNKERLLRSPRPPSGARRPSSSLRHEVTHSVWILSLHEARQERTGRGRSV